MNRFRRWSIFIAIALAVSGCLQMPTPPDRIGGFYVSGVRYEKFNCQQLLNQLDYLETLETQLVISQGQRITASRIQVSLWGTGQGDGIEASALANTRGEKAVILQALVSKDCQGFSQPTTLPMANRASNITDSIYGDP